MVFSFAYVVLNAILFLVPLVFSYTFYLSEVKFLVFVVGTIVLFFLYIRKIKLREFLREVFSSLLNVKSPEFWLFVFISVLGWATIFSIIPGESFWGSPERRQGFITFFFYGLFFYVVRSLPFDLKRLRQSFLWIIGAQSIIIIYALLQKVGFDFLHWGVVRLDIPPFTERILSTIGHPNFLAAWLAMTIPLIVYNSLFSSRVFRIFQWSLILLAIVVIVWTYSRAGFLAILSSLGWLVCLIFFHKKELIKNHLTFLFIFLLVIFCTLASSLIIDSTYKKRIKSIVNIKTPSTIARLNEARFALKKIKERLLLGWGPESYYYLALQRDISPFEPQDGIADRVHNLFLDTAVSGGLLALFSLLGFLFTLIMRFVKIFKENPFLYGVLFSSLIAWFVQIQFSFEVITTGVYFYFIVGLLCNNSLLLLNKELRKKYEPN